MSELGMGEGRCGGIHAVSTYWPSRPITSMHNSMLSTEGSGDPEIGDEAELSGKGGGIGTR